jgi:hypothetical protein
MQASDPHPHMTMFLTLWAVAGPLVGIGGVFLGQRMARRTDQDKFRRDSRKEEFQSLLAALSKAYGILIQLRAPMVALAEQEQRMLFDVETAALTAIRSCVYIADDIKRLDIAGRWTQATRNLDWHGSFASEFAKGYSAINADIVNAANENLK